MAVITLLAAITNSLPAIGTGRGRPLASAGPSSMRMQVTWPGAMRTGAHRYSIATPSSSASAISSAEAGISAWVRR